MKKILTNSFLLALSILFIGACGTSKKAVSDFQKNEDALLWEITGKDLKQPSYLFGTIHMISKKDFFLPEQLESSLDKTDKLVLEINMDEMSDMGAMLGMMGQMMIPGGKTIKDYLSEEDYAIVKERLDGMQMGIMGSFMERIKPFFLSAMIAEGDIEGGKEEQTSYEFELMDIAKSKSKEMGGVETIAFQMGMIDSIPIETQAQMLVEGLKVSEDGKESAMSFNSMVTLYKGQKVDELAALISSETEDSEDFERLLLTKRNYNWIPIMKEMMMEKPCFFAFGAGHLGGAEGVIHLLRKEGYTMKPLKN